MPNSCDELVEYFYKGFEAYHAGIPQVPPADLDLKKAEHWLSGYKSAERTARSNALYPPLSNVEYDAISVAAKKASLRYCQTGIPPLNPYKRRKQREAYEVWQVCFEDAQRMQDGEEWVVLGIPRKIIRRSP